MKDILFKAKVKNWRELPTEEQWVYGYYVRGFNVYEEPIHIIFDPTTIFENNKTDGWDEIDPDTLCRYTGSNDNHDNKIWENDLIECKKFSNGYLIKHFLSQIEWDDGGTGFAFKDGKHSWAFMDSLTVYECQVIGNIFDNPELLEGGGEDE